MFPSVTFGANLDDEIFCVGPGHVGPPSRATIVGSVVHLLAEGGEGVEAAVCLHPNVAPATPIPPRWTPCHSALAARMTYMELHG